MERQNNGKTWSECFQLWKHMKLFQGFIQLHCFMILKFSVLKLNICFGYILHKISLLLRRSLVLTNLYCLIEYILLFYQCLLIILVSTNSNDKCMPASFSEWWVWRVLKEQSWKNPIFRVRKPHLRVRNINKESLLQPFQTTERKIENK